MSIWVSSNDLAVTPGKILYRNNYYEVADENYWLSANSPLHGTCRGVWRRSYQTPDLAHWNSKYMNDFLPRSFVSNVCKLLCRNSRTRGASYNREKCAQALLTSAAGTPWCRGCKRDEWKELQQVNKEGVEFKKRLPWQSLFVSIIAA